MDSPPHFCGVLAAQGSGIKPKTVIEGKLGVNTGTMIRDKYIGI